MQIEQLHKFISIRNKSPFASNLQFEFDAEEAGFSTRELGQGAWVGEHPNKRFRWTTDHGFLEEHQGRLTLRDRHGKQLWPRQR